MIQQAIELSQIWNAQQQRGQSESSAATSSKEAIFSRSMKQKDNMSPRFYAHNPTICSMHRADTKSEGHSNRICVGLGRNLSHFQPWIRIHFTMTGPTGEVSAFGPCGFQRKLWKLPRGCVEVRYRIDLASHVPQSVRNVNVPGMRLC